MSEPYAAFLQLHIARVDLIRWLDAPTPRAAAWSDWREVGGQYYFDDGVMDIAAIPEAELAADVADCDANLARSATNRAALRRILDTAEVRFFKRAAYDMDTQIFTAGSLTYGENLIPYMEFFTVFRGAAAYLGAEGAGIAIVHNYIWGDPEERSTDAAMRLNADGTQRFAAEDEHAAMASTFQPIADAMLALTDPWEPDAERMPQPTDELDSLR